MAGQGEDGRRGDLLAPICAHLLAHGLDRSGLRELAAAAGTSDRMLLYYFRDKADLMAAAMERLAAGLTAQLDAARAPAPMSEAALADRLVGMVLDDEVWPFMQLWLEIAAKGARGDPIFRETGGRIGAGFLDWIAAQSDAPTDAERRAVAARLLPVLDGLILLKAVGLDETCAAPWRSGRPPRPLQG
jgi:AcrR family transcriptional regulator